MSKLTLGALVLVSLVATAHSENGKAVPTTIVLVHGTFADGSSWDKVTPMLEAKGYNVIAVHEPLTSLADDIAATKRAIESAPGKVVLVGHSYGGAVITEAGNDTKVKALVYVAAFAPDAGESISDLGQGQPAPAWAQKLMIDSGGFARLPTDVVLADFAQDLPSADARLLATKQGPISLKALDEKITTAAWHTKPTWYLRAANDHIIDPNGEMAMAKRMKAKLTSVDSSHVIMLAKPRVVSDAITTAAEATRSGS